MKSPSKMKVQQEENPKTIVKIKMLLAKVTTTKSPAEQLVTCVGWYELLMKNPCAMKAKQDENIPKI